jgi:integrase
MSLRIVWRNGIAYIRGTVRGQPCYETAGTSDPELAEAFRAKREAELYESAIFGARAVVGFQRAALSYLEAEPRSKSTKRDVARLVAHFRNTVVGKINQDAADRAVTAIVGDDAAPGTKNRAVYTPLIAILNHAAWREWCDAPRIKKKKPPKGKTRWLTPDEARALILGASAHIRPLIVFLLGTGARMSEAIDLTWRDVDLAEARVVFRDTKNGSERVARMPPAAVAALASLGHRDGAVFRTERGEPYADKERNEGGQIKTAWRTACRRAGLIAFAPAEHEIAADGPYSAVRIVPTATPHDLRHSWATWFYRLARDLLLLKDEGGWKTLSMVERYTHLATSEIDNGIVAIWGGAHPRIGAESVQDRARA